MKLSRVGSRLTRVERENARVEQGYEGVLEENPDIMSNKDSGFRLFTSSTVLSTGTDQVLSSIVFGS